jgi:hypothetical protein
MSHQAINQAINIPMRKITAERQSVGMSTGRNAGMGITTTITPTTLLCGLLRKSGATKLARAVLEKNTRSVAAG